MTQNAAVTCSKEYLHKIMTDAPNIAFEDVWNQLQSNKWIAAFDASNNLPEETLGYVPVEWLNIFAAACELAPPSSIVTMNYMLPTLVDILWTAYTTVVDVASIANYASTILG